MLSDFECVAATEVEDSDFFVFGGDVVAVVGVVVVVKVVRMWCFLAVAQHDQRGVRQRRHSGFWTWNGFFRVPADGPRKF